MVLDYFIGKPSGCLLSQEKTKPMFREQEEQVLVVHTEVVLLVWRACDRMISLFS